MILLITMVLFAWLFFWCLLKVSKDSDGRIEEILSKHNIPFEMHIYPDGPHGMSVVSDETYWKVPKFTCNPVIHLFDILPYIYWNLLCILIAASLVKVITRIRDGSTP